MTASPALPTRAGKDADKYLLDDEKVVLATRRHWAVLIEPTLRFLPVFAVGGWLFLLDPDNRFTTVVGLVLVLVALTAFALRIAEWWMRHFIVTRRRVLLTSGVIARTVTLLPLRRITDLTWQETLLGQVLGYGTFRFESAGQKQGLDEITFIPDADHLYKTLSQLMFGTDFSTNPVGDDDDGTGTLGDRDDEAPPLPPGRRHDTEPIPRTPRPRPVDDDR
jgi:membrane protein YdbS with pleckstrin-like domain